MIRFGAWSTSLGIAAGFGLGIAALLLAAGGDRIANRLLAALLAAASLKLMPYVLGFAGFYDAYPWLSFAPFDFGLALGPLVFLYERRLTGRPLPPRWPAHFAPVAAATLYLCCIFVQPLAFKDAWNERVHAPLVDPLLTGAALLSLGLYLAAAIRGAVAVRPVGGPARQRRRWLLTALVALAAWLGVAAAFEIVDAAVTDLDYYARYPQYLAFAAIVAVLGLEGWRGAAIAVPLAPERDWQALGARWAAEIEAAGWWREPGLTIAATARRLGTNEAYLSRALNDGAGRGFTALVNRLRVEAVQRDLDRPDGRDLLTVAMDAGFASKPSFNRVFREVAGMSPSAWRRRARP